VDDHWSLLEALWALEPRGEDETADLARTLRLTEESDPWRRTAPLHVTASALVLHPPSGRVLLRWHQRQQAWLQVGGHADPGETDPFMIALREATEETGLTDLEPWPGEPPRVVHLVIVPVPPSATEPAHEHADLRYLLATTHPEEARSESPGAPLRWGTPDEARQLTSEANLRETLARAESLLRA
jgi:8-oxo-dGTP pyrophosphatase MutT (NUDIX family)